MIYYYQHTYKYSACILYSTYNIYMQITFIKETTHIK